MKNFQPFSLDMVEKTAYLRKEVRKIQFSAGTGSLLYGYLRNFTPKQAKLS
jgi:hypothetical protein